MADVVRIGIVGTGKGYGRARQAASTAGAQLVAVCTLDEERGRRAASELGCEFIRDYEEMLGRADIDAIGVFRSAP